MESQGGVMRTWGLLIISMVFWVGAAHADSPKADWGTDDVQTRLSDISRRVAGRVLGTFVREGMTEGQVRRILGRDQRSLPMGGTVGGVLFFHWDYRDYGLSVSFLSDHTGVVRVSAVDFRPFFD